MGNYNSAPRLNSASSQSLEFDFNHRYRDRWEPITFAVLNNLDLLRSRPSDGDHGNWMSFLDQVLSVFALTLPFLTSFHLISHFFFSSPVHCKAWELVQSNDKFVSLIPLNHSSVRILGCIWVINSPLINTPNLNLCLSLSNTLLTQRDNTILSPFKLPNDHNEFNLN